MLKELPKSLEDKKVVERELESLSKLVMSVYDKLKELELEVLLGESLNPKSEEILVLDYFQLVSRLKMGNKKLYEILRRLEAKGKVRKLRKGKKVHYVLVEE